MRPKAILSVLAISGLAALTGCAAIDAALGGPSDEGFIEPLVRPFSGVPGPMGLGATALLALCNIWQAVRGGNWKRAATDGVVLFEQLKADPAGRAIWDQKIKPRWDEAKKRKNMSELLAIIKDVQGILKSGVK